MPKTIELIFDFVSPNAFLAWYPLPLSSGNRSSFRMQAVVQCSISP